MGFQRCRASESRGMRLRGAETGVWGGCYLPASQGKAESAGARPSVLPSDLFSECVAL